MRSRDEPRDNLFNSKEDLLDLVDGSGMKRSDWTEIEHLGRKEDKEEEVKSIDAEGLPPGGLVAVSFVRVSRWTGRNPQGPRGRRTPVQLRHEERPGWPGEMSR